MLSLAGRFVVVLNNNPPPAGGRGGPAWGGLHAHRVLTPPAGAVRGDVVGDGEEGRGRAARRGGGQRQGGKREEGGALEGTTIHRQDSSKTHTLGSARRKRRDGRGECDSCEPRTG